MQSDFVVDMLGGLGLRLVVDGSAEASGGGGSMNEVENQSAVYHILPHPPHTRPPAPGTIAVIVLVPTYPLSARGLISLPNSSRSGNTLAGGGLGGRGSGTALGGSKSAYALFCAALLSPPLTGELIALLGSSWGVPPARGSSLKGAPAGRGS